MPETKVRYLARADLRDLENLDTGVLFILAWWSGPALVALDHLAKAFLRAKAGGSIEFLIVDTDGIPEFYESVLLRGKIHGGGESLWKKGKEIVDITRGVLEIQDYENRILRLLS